MILLVCRFAGAGPDFLDNAREPVALLAAQPTCRNVRLGRSTDDAEVWTLTAEFDSVPAYRRALGPFDVRTVVVPFLSTAEQGTSGVFEVALHSGADPSDPLTEPTLLVRP
ncbi:antibiotic biosynthesis monooxygenase [Nakamurella deserti]|uniref:antibiotic biosynthesis monooxygenase n=1 Tax=Nakamurella deserti TaxID=2164074 RepID=UPI000DBE6B1B|nr:antibiotic biosynthesis monooxygenase [Nakamurella deserti]